MVELSMTGQTNDDPRKLSALISRVSDLAETHAVSSVVVGLTSQGSDLAFPEYVHFLQSALRVEDGIFRMTRERAVIHLADCDREQARKILVRLMGDFVDEFPSLMEPAFEMRFVEVQPGGDRLTVKDVLTEIFSQRVLH
jgi:hypothetical protein